MLALLSPAKDLDFDSPILDIKATQPRLPEHSKDLMQTLKQAQVADVAALMHLSEKLALLNYTRFQDWRWPQPKRRARQAIWAFNGDVYQGLQARSWAAEDVAFAQSHVRILSGLYGLLRPLDAILPYRLEMGTSLATERGRDLYQFWGETVTQLLNKDLKAEGSGLVVNLASQEYFKVVKPKHVAGRIIEPVFKDYHAPSGTYKIISFFAKKARGQMCAYIVN
ncbi:MAG TPA: peroxide stress protein YaaA, partial [Cellvibrionaceae bacterium]|nr:peroxide stress protein YaaA [Cellvibrionaceae bacterium]